MAGISCHSPYSNPDLTLKILIEKNETIEQLRTVGWTHFYNITNITELNYQFKTIANYLLDSWKVLNCFLSPGIKGRVCWTFGKKVPIYRTPQPQPKPQPKPETKRQVFVGINGGVGIPFSFFDYMSMGLDAKLGVDFAFPISDRFAMGAYTSFGGGLIFEEFDELSGLGHFNVGLLMLCGDMNKPLLIGVSPGTGVVFANMARAVPLELRFGRIKKDHFYVT